MYTLASTKNNQSASNLVKMFVTVRSWKSSIINLIKTECQSYLPFIKKKSVIFDFVYTLSSANIDQSVPNLVKIFLSNRIWMSLIMGPNGPEQLSYLLLNWEKLLHLICLLTSIYKYKPISTKFGHNEYEHRSQMSLIMGLIIRDQSVLSALE